MSTDRSPFAGHLADDTLLLLGDVADQAAFSELVEALVADDAFGTAPGLASADALTVSWRHLTGCPTCSTRRASLMGVVVSSLAMPGPTDDPRWSTEAHELRIAAALDELTPSSASVSDDLGRRNAPTAQRKWFNLGGGRRGGDVGLSSATGSGVLSGRRLLIGAAVAAFAVGTVIALRPNTSQVGALKVSADTTAPADGFAAGRITESSVVTKRVDAAADSSASLDDPLAGLPAPAAGEAAPTSAPSDASATAAPPTPAPEPASEAAVERSSSDQALDEGPATSVPLAVDSPVVAAAAPTPPAPAPAPPQAAVPAPPQAAVPAPAKKVAGTAAQSSERPATAALPSVSAGAAPPAAASVENATDGSVADLGTFADTSAVLDRFATLHPAAPATTAPATAAPAAAAPAIAGASSAATPVTTACSSRVGTFRSTATVGSRSVVVLRIRDEAGEVDVVFDAGTCAEVTRRPVTP